MTRISRSKKAWSSSARAIVATMAALVGTWAVVVGMSAYGINVFGVEWDFERTGQLGDSFGVVGAIMATAAAAFTLLTLRDQRAENSRLREREADRDRADDKREAEATFFRLLDLRNSILERVRDPLRATSHQPVLGQRAIKIIADGLAAEVARSSNEVKTMHDAYWAKVEGEVGHYLRFTYHIVRFAATSFDNDRDRYSYIRLLRAQLSNAEVELIALNSAYGAGDPRMKVYVEHFALIHSLPEDTIERLRLRSLFASSAFDSHRWIGASSEADAKPKSSLVTLR